MSFADSFWTSDFESGLKTLFGKLYQGSHENEEFIQLFSSRMETELVYGNKLDSILAKNKLNPQGFGKNIDDNSSIKTAFLRVNEQFGKEGDYHLQVANNIKIMVVDPFAKWTREHRQRIEYSEEMLFSKLKVFGRAKSELERSQKRYFNKCRMLEEFKSSFGEDELSEQLETMNIETEDVEGDTPEKEEIYDFCGHPYDTKSIREILKSLITSIPLISHKVAILGTYTNVSTGSSITQWLTNNLDFDVGKAEMFGQDLIKYGFLRLIGSVGSNFINSSHFYYQWKPLTFELTGVMMASLETNVSNATAAPMIKNYSVYLEDMKQAIGVNTIDYNDRTSLTKLIREVNDLDATYYKQVVSLDRLRCEFEELIMDHLSFMQKCEFDRLKALKKVMLDFVAVLSNKIVSLKSVVDELMVFEETINPISDLKFLIDNYQTGQFNPQVVLYDNYYNSTEKQTFGVDIEIKSRIDKKIVPIIVSSTLMWLDNIYPDLANDEERISLWIKPIHLNQIHELRFKLNGLTEQEAILAAFEGCDPIVVTNLLKLYLLELPDSLISSNYYDLIKSIYANYNDLREKRITGLQNTLSELPKTNIATLDAILTHLTRLIVIIGSKNETQAIELQTKLSKEFANLILRPKYQNNGKLTLNDKHQYKFMSDLLDFKDEIFKELRRRNSKRTGSNVAPKKNLNEKLKEAVAKGKKLKADESTNLSRTTSGVAVNSPVSSINNSANNSSSNLSDEPSTPSPTLKRSSSPRKSKRDSRSGDEKSNSTETLSKDETEVIVVD